MSRHRVRLLLAVLLVGVLAAGSVLLVRMTWWRPLTVEAQFTSATGIYPGDEVRIAGVRVGTIESIEPGPEYASVNMAVDSGVNVPADAKAVIVAQNLVAARYVQLAPLYQPGTPRMANGAVIPTRRTAIPVEWDDVKDQLAKLGNELGPTSDVSSSSVGRFIDSAADALDDNGATLRQTFAQLSQLARIFAEGSGDVAATIEHLQTFVTALRDSTDHLVVFQDRLATFGSVLADSRADIDAAMSELALAVGEVRRFVAGTRDKTSEQVQRLANATQVLVDHRLDVENILHNAPTAFANAYNILNPNLPGAVGTFVVNNFSNPVAFICSAIGAIENVTAPETAKRCQQYFGPALRLLTLNYLPIPMNPLLAPVVTPDKIHYTDPALAPGGAGGAPVPPEQPPSISAYTGLDGDVAPPPGYGPAPPAFGPAPPAPVPSLPDVLLPAEGTPPP